MAMTAWSANVCKSAICFPESAPGNTLVTPMAPMAVPSRIMGAIVAARFPIARMTSKAPRGLSVAVS